MLRFIPMLAGRPLLPFVAPFPFSFQASAVVAFQPQPPEAKQTFSSVESESPWSFLLSFKLLELSNSTKVVKAMQSVLDGTYRKVEPSNSAELQSLQDEHNVDSIRYKTLEIGKRQARDYKHSLASIACVPLNFKNIHLFVLTPWILLPAPYQS